MVLRDLQVGMGGGWRLWLNIFCNLLHHWGRHPNKARGQVIRASRQVCLALIPTRWLLSPNYTAVLELALLSFIWVLPGSNKYSTFVKILFNPEPTFIVFFKNKHTRLIAWPSFCLPLEMSSLEIRNSDFCFLYNLYSILC